MAAVILEEGCGSTGSRLPRGDRTSFSVIEQRFATFKGTEAALHFGSGYAAILRCCLPSWKTGDVVFCNRLTMPT